MTMTILEKVKINTISKEDLAYLIGECYYLADELEYKSGEVKRLFLKALESTNLTFKFKAALFEFLEFIHTNSKLVEMKIKLYYKNCNTQDLGFKFILDEIQKTEDKIQSKLQIIKEIGNAIINSNMSIEGFDQSENYKFN